MIRTAFAALLLALAHGCGSAPEPKPTRELTPDRLFPLTKGSAWSYDVDTGDGNVALAITKVTEADGQTASVQGGEGVTRYELRPDGIFRTNLSGYLLKAPLRVGASWPSGGGMQAEVTRMDAELLTPAGELRGCVEVVERGAPSGAVITTIYCPEVGPALVVSKLEMITGKVEVIARLRGYQIGPGANAGPSSNPAPMK